MPSRIQRRRTPGWHAPLDAQRRKPVYVGRGTRWGNPNRIVYRRDTRGWHVEHDNGGGLGTFPSDREARRFAVDAYRHHLKTHPEIADAARRELAGRDLMCWCASPEPGHPDDCHAAVLLELVNGKDSSR